ncbi:MAG: hypothetical protein BGP04_19055 [Rhizobiales bacterium 62-17]|nr:MAG: hypothetical protein BGP04_19055 [Rhizobiales bacterium 62-17]
MQTIRNGISPVWALLNYFKLKISRLKILSRAVIGVWQGFAWVEDARHDALAFAADMAYRAADKSSGNR